MAAKARERRELRYNFTFQEITPEVDRLADVDAFTPRAAIRYELAPRTNVYASYLKGFRSGVFDPVATANPAFALPVKPEKITAYEIGFKTASRKLRFDTAGWYYDFKNLQVGLSIADPTDPNGLRLIQTIGNAGKARSYGAEAQLQYTPIENLNVRAGAPGSTRGTWISRMPSARSSSQRRRPTAPARCRTGWASRWRARRTGRAMSG